MNAPVFRYLNRIVFASVIDNQIFNLINAINLLRQIVQCDFQSFRLIVTWNLYNQLHCTSRTAHTRLLSGMGLPFSPVFFSYFPIVIQKPDISTSSYYQSTRKSTESIGAAFKLVTVQPSVYCPAPANDSPAYSSIISRYFSPFT